jgi:hypothetical protein
MNCSELQIHQGVIQHIKLRGVPGLVYWHSPQGAFYGSKRQGAMLKSMGVRPGVSDLILVHGGKIYALELKAPGGRASAEQIQFCGDMERQGAFTALPVGLDAALATLESWGLLRGGSM